MTDDSLQNNDPAAVVAGSGGGSAHGASLPYGGVLGEFEILEVLGRGGMGTVYRAWQQSLHRLVALKVLAPHVADSPSAVVRFQREAQAAAKLHHSHIVPIHAQGCDRGHYYYAMELVDGVSLHALIQEERLTRTGEGQINDIAETVVSSSGDYDPDATLVIRSDSKGGPRSVTDSSVSLALEPAANADADRYENIAMQCAAVADALEYAHVRGIIHRDIKPHNLILSRDGRLQITDFGLARVLEQPGVTVTGEFIGSPLYMSPEQISGDGDQVDRRADVYSLAATMYEWLTLRPPFPGRTRESVIGQVLRGDPEPPRSIDPAVPQDLETIVLRAMERDPARRYATAADLRDDLRSFVRGGRIRAKRAGWMVRGRRYVARHPRLSGVVASVVVLAAAAGLWWRAKSNIAADKADVIQRESVVAQKEAQVEEQLVQLDSILKNLPLESLIVKGAEIVGEQGPGLVESTAKALKNEEGPIVSPALQADVGTLGSIARRAVEDLFHSRPLDAVRAQTLAFDPRLMIFQQAIDSLDPDAAIRNVDAYVRDPSDYTALYLRTLLNARAGRYEEMADDAAALTTHPSAGPHAHILMGLADLFANDWTATIDDCTQALVADETLHLAWAVKGLAELRLGLLDDALADFQKSLELFPDSVVGRLGRAFTYFSRARHDEAIADCTHVLELEPDNADALVSRGEFFKTAGRFDEALADFSAAMSAVGNSAPAKLRIWQKVQATQGSAGSVRRSTADSGRPVESVPTPPESTTPTRSPGSSGTMTPPGYPPMQREGLRFRPGTIARRPGWIGLDDSQETATP